MVDFAVSRGSGLIRRGVVWYALVTVPTDLWLAMGSSKPVKQKWVSLRTGHRVEAKARKHAVLDQWAGTFADMRRRQNLTEADMAVAVYDHYVAEVAEGGKERASRPTEEQIMAVFDAGVAQASKPHPLGSGAYDHINATTNADVMALKPKLDASRRAARLLRLRTDLGNGDTRLIETDVDAFLQKNGFGIAHGTEQYRDFCFKMMRSEIEQLERYAERDRGDFTGKPKDPNIAEPTDRPAPIGVPPESIMGLFDKYEKANPRNMQAAPFKQVRRDVENFVAFLGPRVAPGKIDRASVAAWMDMLFEYPVKATETKIFKGMTPQQAAAANNVLDTPRPTLSTNTVRRYMSSLSGFCRWLKIRSLLPEILFLTCCRRRAATMDDGASLRVL